MKFEIRDFKELIKKDFKELVNGLIVLPTLKDLDMIVRFNNLKDRYQEIYKKFQIKQSAMDNNSVGYDWGSWSGKIREAFSISVPLDFLSNPLISLTMTFKRVAGVKDTQDRIKILEDMYSEQELSALLKEDYIGKPVISNSKHKTSANRAHHASHLSFYKKNTRRNFWDTKSIIEFGGGYGNMARIIRRINPKVTYIIIDLPELLALQYIYLASLESENRINIINDNNINIAQGKINLVSSELVFEKKVKLDAESFISTWALSEAPKFLQHFVVKSNFFGAKELLLASCIDTNNNLNDILDFNDIRKDKVPFLSGDHEYWFR
jgi:hypothetical protein